MVPSPVVRVLMMHVTHLEGLGEYTIDAGKTGLLYQGSQLTRAAAMATGSQADTTVIGMLQLVL